MSNQYGEQKQEKPQPAKEEVYAEKVNSQYGQQIQKPEGYVYGQKLAVGHLVSELPLAGNANGSTLVTVPVTEAIIPVGISAGI